MINGNVIGKVTIVIPSLNPDEKLLIVVHDLIANGFDDIIVIDDGSEENCKEYFMKINDFKECTVITHECNKGKGRALKSAFQYLSKNRKDIVGAITVDGDNQHQVKDIINCKNEFLENPTYVVLGCRDFEADNVPPKSRFGNKLTRFMFQFACGLKITDTQTGLRAIPYAYLNDFINIDGERYEYETNMLLKIKEMEIPIQEVKIETVYLDNNRASHFHPIRDSIKIYLIIIKYLFCSVLSSLIDITVFTIVLLMINDNMEQANRILIATVTARVISSLFNYLGNRQAVFKSQASVKKSFIKYYILCVLQMLASYGSVYTLSYMMHAGSVLEVIVKVFVDTILFVISFQIQRRWVFKK